MNLSFEITCADRAAFLARWSARYDYPDEGKYTRNIGKPLISLSRRELFEWKNGGRISQKKLASIESNYPLVFEGDLEERYLNHRKEGGAIWNIFYLHCLDPATWPIFDQHTFRAMRYLQSGVIEEIGRSKKAKYEAYLESYLPFFRQFGRANDRHVDKALFTFGQFLKLAARYT